MQTIPASQIASVTPSVISAGGLALSLNGVILTQSTRAQIGTVPSFPSAAGVGAFFGLNSTEYALSQIYFGGFLNSNKKPGALFFAQYNETAVAAYLRGGSLASMTVAQLGALGSGTVIAVMDGYSRTSASINLTGVGSFSAAATLIATGLNTTEPTEATSTASSIAGTVLTVGGTLTGTFAVGQTVTGSSVTAGTVITSLGTGTGGAGTYNLSATSTVSSEAISATATPVTVTYDSIASAFVITSGITGTPSAAAFCTGTLATGLALTSATGATTSQGAAPATPAAFMPGLTAVTTNWCSFMTTWESVGAEALAFATWEAAQINRYLYAYWSTDITVTQAGDTAAVGYQIIQAGLGGVALTYAPQNGASASAFVMGAIASIDFSQTNGRATLFGKSAPVGLVPDVSNGTVSAQLLINGFNFYGIYSTANQTFTFFNPGSVTGPYSFIDSYVNQIWLNNQFQLDLMVLATQLKSLPYTQVGYALVKAALLGTIIQAGNFGVFSAGVPLSPLQAAEVNNAAGTPIDQQLTNQGYYLQILPASPQVRGLRQTPPMTFWYTDGESIQSFNLASVLVQ